MELIKHRKQKLRTKPPRVVEYGIFKKEEGDAIPKAGDFVALPWCQQKIKAVKVEPSCFIIELETE